MKREARLDRRRDRDRGRRRGRRGLPRARREAPGGPDGQGRSTQDRAEGQRHREDPAQDQGGDQRRRERQDHQASRGRGTVGREGRLPRRARPRALHRRRSRARRRMSAPPRRTPRWCARTWTGPRRNSSGPRSSRPAGWSPRRSSSTKEAAYQVEAARYKSAQDQVAQAKAALKQARDDLSKTTIYAPMAGTISALNKEQGEIALGSQFQKDVILVIADLSAMEAQVNVDENDIVSHRRRAGGRDRGRRDARHGAARAGQRDRQQRQRRGRRHAGPEDRIRDQDRDHRLPPRPSARA